MRCLILTLALMAGVAAAQMPKNTTTQTYSGTGPKGQVTGGTTVTQKVTPNGIGITSESSLSGPNGTTVNGSGQATVTTDGATGTSTWTGPKSNSATATGTVATTGTTTSGNAVVSGSNNGSVSASTQVDQNTGAVTVNSIKIAHPQARAAIARSAVVNQAVARTRHTGT